MHWNMLPSSHRCHAQWSVCARALDHSVERVREHKPKLSRVAVQRVNLWPPVQVGLEVDHIIKTKGEVTLKNTCTATKVKYRSMTHSHLWLFCAKSWPGQSERWRGRTRPDRPAEHRNVSWFVTQLLHVQGGKYDTRWDTLKCWLLWGLMRKQETKQSIMSSTSAFWLPAPLQNGLAGLNSKACWDSWGSFHWIQYWWKLWL